MKNHQPNAGSSLLSQKLKTRGDLVALARHLRVSHGAVSYWRSGRSLPKIHQALALEKKYGIPTDSWDRPVSKTERPKESARVAANIPPRERTTWPSAWLDDPECCAACGQRRPV